jgi:hypothetical protein
VIGPPHWQIEAFQTFTIPGAVSAPVSSNTNSRRFITR